MAIKLGESFSMRPSDILDNWYYDEFIVTYAKIINKELSESNNGQPYIRFMDNRSFEKAAEMAKILEDDENRQEFIKSVENGS